MYAGVFSEGDNAVVAKLVGKQMRNWHPARSQRLAGPATVRLVGTGIDAFREE